MNEFLFFWFFSRNCLAAHEGARQSAHANMCV
jgi:hypothetical protein